MVVKSIGILGSRNLACRILEWIVVQESGVEIVGVVVPPFSGWWNDDLKRTASKLGCKILTTIEELLEAQPDMVFSINYWKVIPKHQIDVVPRGIVNIHHSYRLKYRGRYSTSWAIMNARRLDCWYHGTSLHFISSILDAGPIIDSRQCKITNADTAYTLFLRVEELAFKMFVDNYFRLVSSCGAFEFLEPYDDFIYYDKSSRDKIEFNRETTLIEIQDFVRAWSFPGRPMPRVEYDGGVINFLEFINLNSK